MKKMKIVLLLVSAVITATAQIPEKQFKQLQEQYPDKVAVYLDYTDDLTIDIAGDTAVMFTEKHHRTMFHLKEQSNMYAKDNIYTSSLVKMTSIDAKTLVPEKKDYRSIKVTAFNTKTASSSYIFYDDNIETSFMYPAIQPGVQTELNYTTQSFEPRFYNMTFLFGSYVPVKKAVYRVSVDKNIQINFKVLRDEQHIIKFKKTDKGRYNVYEWYADDIPELAFENSAPDIRYYAPHVVCFIDNIRLRDTMQVMFSSLKGLYNVYAPFAFDVKCAHPEEIQNIVKKITEGMRDERAKARAIFYWVQDNIRYIAFADGMRGLIPQDASEVIKNRYGDCKGMANLIVAMYTAAGINGKIAWIGTRDIPYRYSELPSPSVDNHMIAVYMHGNECVFLDATHNFMPFGLPTDMIQGKEALIGITRDSCVARVVPVIPAEKNFQNDSCVLSIQDTKISGSGTTTYGGYVKANLTLQLQGKNTTEQKNDALKILGRGNNKFFLQRYAIDNIKDRDEPLQISYQFSLESYVQKINNEYFINMNLNKDFSESSIDVEKRTLPVEQDFQRTMSYKTILELPANAVLESMPADQTYTNDQFGFEIKYYQKGNSIVYEKKIYLKYLMLTKDSFKKWNEMITALNKAYRDVVILKEK